MKYSENSGNRMKAIFSASQAEGRGFDPRFPLLSSEALAKEGLTLRNLLRPTKL